MLVTAVNGVRLGLVQLLSDAKLRGLFWISLALAIGAVLLALGGAWLIADWILTSYLSWFPDWAVSATDIGASIGIFGLMWIIFPAIVTGIASIFLDNVAKRVEIWAYPDDPVGEPPPFWPAVWLALKFVALVVAVNILLIPLYIIGFFFPLLLVVIFLVNGWLMGREYFELVGYRHMPPRNVYRARRKNSGIILLGGIIIAFGFSIPVVNLLTPLLGIAMMVHIFKSLQGGGRTV